VSAYIGRFPGNGIGRNIFELHVSRAGAEITPRYDETGTLSPLEARAFAAALVLAAEECERMRSKRDPEAPPCP
jgi:hypothetical protein